MKKVAIVRLTMHSKRPERKGDLTFTPAIIIKKKKEDGIM